MYIVENMVYIINDYDAVSLYPTTMVLNNIRNYLINDFDAMSLYPFAMMNVFHI